MNREMIRNLCMLLIGSFLATSLVGCRKDDPEHVMNPTEHEVLVEVVNGY